MFYGLQFNTSGGESMQVVINTALQVYARASSGGIFGEWKYVCGPGEGDGALEVEKATVAEKAYRLASPMTITFAGDAQGAVSFDGSGNVTATLSVRNGSVDVSDLVNDSLNALIRDKNSILMKKVQSMIDEAISYHVNKSGWHVSQDPGGQLMPTLLIPGFGGEVPRIEPRTLEAHQSARAVNCDLRRGSLRPLRGVRRVAEVSASARTIFKHDIDGWLAWDKDVSVVKSAIIDVIGETPLGHLLITGDRDYPTQRFAGGETYRLGIPRPETAPTVTVKAGAGIGDVSVHGFIAGSGGDMPTKDSQLAPVEGQGVAVAPIVFSSIDGIPPSTEAEKISRSSSYCYTYVQSLQNGVYQQESAPSLPSELVDVKSGDGALVSGFRRLRFRG